MPVGHLQQLLPIISLGLVLIVNVIIQMTTIYNSRLHDFDDSRIECQPVCVIMCVDRRN